MADEKTFHGVELSNPGTDKLTNHVTDEAQESGDVLSPRECSDLPDVAKEGFTQNDQRDMQRMGKKQEFRVRKSPNISSIIVPMSLRRTSGLSRRLRSLHVSWIPGRFVD